ncbi:MAG: peptide deformylase [Candidatus Taylorbacteria bacterium]
MKKIVQKDEKVLRQIAKEIPEDEIVSPKIRKVIEEMKEALHKEADGVGLAAPQLGYSLRLFIIDPNLSEKIRRRSNPDSLSPPATKKVVKSENEVFINPVIVKLSKEKVMVDEGCLSVRPLFGKIERSARAKIRAYDENGKLFERGASGLLAQIFQHEIDHLNGILFIDKAVDVKELTDEEISINK